MDYDRKVKYNDNDDLKYAISNNSGSLVSFKEEDIEEIAFEVCGENDGYDWWWIVRLSDGRFALLHGGCDYTGWDCQSHLKEDGVFGTALQAAEAAPEKEGYSNRNIRKNLVGQVNGTQPRFIYQE